MGNIFALSPWTVNGLHEPTMIFLPCLLWLIVFQIKMTSLQMRRTSIIFGKAQHTILCSTSLCLSIQDTTSGNTVRWEGVNTCCLLPSCSSCKPHITTWLWHALTCLRSSKFSERFVILFRYRSATLETECFITLM